MNRRIPWDSLLELMGRFPNGASLEELIVGLGPAVSRRTLQRWLASLVKSKEVVAIGRARARRYQLRPVSEKAELVTYNEALFPLTKEGKWIQGVVSEPLHARRPVTYHREFLESYQPNATYYLPEDLRKRLLAMGGMKEGEYPAGTYARQIFHRLLVDLSWNSSRLEGNTYSLLETERLLDTGSAAPGKNLKETQMILNHKAAIAFLIDSAEGVGINRFTILNLHTLLSDNLMPDPAACGRLRSFSVGISHSTYLPIAIPAVIEECFDLLVSKAGKIEDPLEQAFFLMVHIPYLQAFDDVNKRTSRLAANIPLIKKNICPLSFMDVPEQLYINGLIGIYELNRVELLRDVFAWAYERSCALYSTVRQSIGDPDPFRLQYRKAIGDVVREVVRRQLNKVEALSVVRKLAIDLIPKQDQLRFIEIVERELLALHEGNVARYQLGLAEYEGWKRSW